MSSSIFHIAFKVFFFLLTYLITSKNIDDNDVNRWLTLDGNLIILFCKHDVPNTTFCYNGFEIFSVYILKELYCLVTYNSPF